MKKAIYSKQHKTLTTRLKAARIQCGLSQIQVSKILETTQSHISKIESGQRRLDIIQLKVFAKLYKKELISFVP